MIFRILDNKTHNAKTLPFENMSNIFSNDSYSIDGHIDHEIIEANGKILLCFGGYNVIKNNILNIDNNVDDVLSRLLELDDIREIQSCLQGKYVLVLIYNNKIQIIHDSFARADIYYSSSDGAIAVATELSLIPMDNSFTEYNQNALAQMLTSYGNRPSKKQTIYNKIARLGVSELIILDEKGLNISEADYHYVNTRRYTKKDHDKYCDIFLESLEQAGSTEGNIVYLSSGWDSTSILAGLVHVFGAAKVEVLTGRMKYSPRSKICNSIEIEKVSKFSEYYKVNSEIVDFDYAENGLNLVESALPIMKKHGFYNITAVNHFILANAARKMADGANKVVFAGEISDGVHNFGYSQYVTKFHPSYGFREYADKMASYLFGPTFLRRIIDGDYKDDPIYKIFYSDADFIVDDVKCGEPKIKLQLVIDFFLRNGRRPFWSSDNIKMLTSNGVNKYTDYHCNEYLSSASDIHYDTLYSYYLHLYNSFHWQGSTVAPLQVMASEHGLKSCLPFWDKHLQDFLAAMPEDWGRGLDLNNTKYPLKWMLENKFDYPIELQDGPHSYTYDTDHTFNHYEEILRHSDLSPDVRKVITEFDFETMLSPEYFDMSYFSELKTRFNDGDNLTGVELNEVASLYFLGKLKD